MSEPVVDHTHLEVKSVFSEQERVVETAQAFAQKHLGDSDRAYELVLATSEAVTNAMRHGNESDPEKSVRIDFRAFEDCIEVQVEDEGAGFDRAAITDPLEEQNLLRPHGRGVYLIEALAQDVIYENRGRRLRMVFGKQGP